MLVEDDKSLREIYSIRLVAEGYNIVSAGDGEEGLALAVQEKPDLIIADVMMPKISGFDMLDILRSTPETTNVKVIMMTALSSDDQRQRGEALGADRYLVKSQVGIEDVVNAVHDLLGDAPNTNAAGNLDTVAAIPIQQPAPGEAITPATPNYEAQQEAAAQAAPAQTTPAQATPVQAVPAQNPAVDPALAMATAQAAQVATQATPVAPAIPETPATPVAPTAPVATVAPEVPAVPAAPSMPEAPATPVVPETPVAPTTPVAPEVPVVPPVTQPADQNSLELAAAEAAANLAASAAAVAQVPAVPVAPEAPAAPVMSEASVEPPVAPVEPSVAPAEQTAPVFPAMPLPPVEATPAAQVAESPADTYIPPTNPTATEAPVVPEAPVTPAEAPVATDTMQAPVTPIDTTPAAPVAPVEQIETPQIAGGASAFTNDSAPASNDTVLSSNKTGGERVIQPISDPNAPSSRDRLAAEMDAILNNSDPPTPTDNPFNVPTPPQLNIPSESANIGDTQSAGATPASAADVVANNNDNFLGATAETQIVFNDPETAFKQSYGDNNPAVDIDKFEREQVENANKNLSEQFGSLDENEADKEENVEAIKPAYMTDLTSQLLAEGENNQSELENPLAAQMARELADDPVTLEAERLRETGEAEEMVKQESNDILSDDEINDALPDFLKSENLSTSPNIQSPNFDSSENAEEVQSESSSEEDLKDGEN